MRAIQAKDLGLISKIVGKMEVRDEIKGMFVDVTGMDENQLQQVNQELGMQVIIMIVENYWKAEKEVYKLLANLTDKTIKEVEELPVGEFTQLLKQLKEDEGFNSFFGLVSG